MQSKNWSIVQVIFGVFFMFMAHSCGSDNSPTATNQIPKTELSTSELRTSDLSKSNHESDKPTAQSTGVVEITNLTPSDGATVNIPPSASSVNVNWSTTATFPYYTNTIPRWTELKVWIDGEQLYAVTSYVEHAVRTASGTKTLLEGVHTIKVEATHEISSINGGQTQEFGPYSQENTFTVVDPTPPPPAPNVTATTQAGHPRLSWGHVSTAVLYKLTRVENGGSPISWTQSSRTYTDWSENALPTVLGNLMYKVQSINSEGQVGASAVKFYTTF